MNVLIIGGCGYVGSAIFDYLKDKHKVQTVDLEWYGNFNNTSNIKVDFNDLDHDFLDQFDVIVHTAANSSVQLCSNIYDTFHNNVFKFVNLVKKIKKSKFIYASSSCVYVTSNGIPKTEIELSAPSDGLTFSKTTIDNLMPLLDVEYYGLRFGSVNGWSPNMRTDLMINSMTTSALKNGEVNIFNSKAYRPILSTLDLAKSVESVILNKFDNRGVYNVASINKNIGEIGECVANYLKVPLVNKGDTKTYDFTISSESFINKFEFKFEATIENIVQSILDHPFNNKWTNRV
jgi:nucleoside-diphosphate-sugar epimerase